MWNRANAVVAVSASPQEQAALTTVDLFETGFGVPRSIPYGLSALVNKNQGLIPLVFIARNSIRKAYHTCYHGNRPEVAFGRFHTGRCKSDRYTRHEAQYFHLILDILYSLDLRIRPLGI